MERCPAVIESKVRLFQIIKEIKHDEPLWQITADGMNEEAAHILFAGIRYGDKTWRLCKYTIPFKFTEQGYTSYLQMKQAVKERFVKNVLEAGKRARGKGQTTKEKEHKSMFQMLN